jgi:hypothetical protein
VYLFYLDQDHIVIKKTITLKTELKNLVNAKTKAGPSDRWRSKIRDGNGSGSDHVEQLPARQ